jgi:hypothetical protein
MWIIHLSHLQRKWMVLYLSLLFLATRKFFRIYIKRKKNIHWQYKIILYCQSITIIFSVTSPHLISHFDMKWSIELLLLVINVKLIYTNNTYPLNSINIWYVWDACLFKPSLLHFFTLVCKFCHKYSFFLKKM